MKRLQITMCLGMLLVASACELPADEVDCTGVALVAGAITLGPSDIPIRDVLVVRGNAEHPSGLTIRSIDISGVSATNENFNFGLWSAEVPFDQLAALAAQSATGKASIVARATDSCGVVSELGRFDVEVDPTPEIVVDTLDMVVEIPSEELYLPVEGPIAAQITIIGNAKAAGAFVQLDSSLGQFQGADETGSIVLRGDGEVNQATATVFFRSDMAGTALLTASSAGLLAQGSVTIAGGPTLVPAGGSLVAGQTIQVSVFTDGTVRNCQAVPAAGILVTSNGENLMASPGGEDINGDGRVDIEITVQDDLVDFTEIVVTCQDIYGQATTGNYTAEPTELEGE
jgi:hypothetical protein